MKAIRQKARFLAMATGLSVLATGLIIFQNLVVQLNTKLFLLPVSLVTVFLFVFLIREYRKLRIAGLIIENIIMHIQSAKIDVSTCGKSDITLHSGGIEIFVSCFGILLDSQVIKFNLDGIDLKAVEIGREFICLTYGTDQQTQRTRILHGVIGNQELQSMVKKFHYDTGVVPVIIDW